MEGPFLRPEVMALQGPPPEERGLAHKQQRRPGLTQVNHTFLPYQ